MLNKKNYKLLKFLGEGGYGRVYLYYDNIGQRNVAIKKLRIRNEDELNLVKNEIDLLKELFHPNIINYYGYFYDNESFQANIVMECAEDGNLNELIERKAEKFEKFKEQKILEYFTQICEGLNAIQQAKIIYRDLNPCIIINLWNPFKDITIK